MVYGCWDAVDKEFIEKIKTLNIQTKDKERLRFGSNMPSQYVKGTGGKRDLFIVSEGLLEKGEIDEIIQVEKEKEEARLKRKEVTATNLIIGGLVHEAKKAPKGKRAETIDKILKEG